ncbi:MAG: polysaccharide lyase family 7 protein, partial [Myxococcota bacterium]
EPGAPDASVPPEPTPDAGAPVDPAPDAGTSDPVTPDAGVVEQPGDGLDPTALPAENFDLTHWKLTIPGPTEIKPDQLASYSSNYFYTDPVTGAMAFWLDSSEEGSTANSSYVRSELREMMDPNDKTVNWPMSGTHVLTADLQLLYTSETPDQVTVLQIHGITDDGGNVPPLLRVALMDGDLYAKVKTNASGSDTESVLLTTGINSDRFVTEVRVVDSRLIITVNGVVELDRDVSFWDHRNYFKAGLYPQAQSGISEARFYALTVSHQ